MEKGEQTLQSSESMIKTDITLLAIQTRGMAGILYKQMIEKRYAWQPYLDFVELFFQLYQSFKYNARFSKKIEDWANKEKMYDKLFYVDLINGRKVLGSDGKPYNTKFFPNTLLRLYDEFVKDMRVCGIYDLSQNEFVGKGGI